MNGSVLQLTLREWLDVVRRPRLLGIFAIVVALFAITGPFGTITRLNAAERFTYWLLVQGFAWSTAIGCSILSANLLRERLAGLLPRLVIGSVLSAIPIGLQVMLLEAAFTGRVVTLPVYGENVITALPLCLLFSLLTYIALGGQEPQVQDMEQSAPEPAGFPLARRLRPENRGALIRLSADDHYTDVVTRAGRELILIRFSDALLELGSQVGMQVHRSHWVADDAVAQVKAANGRMVVLTSDGAEIPVSRANQAEAKARFAERNEAGGRRSAAD